MHEISNLFIIIWNICHHVFSFEFMGNGEGVIMKIPCCDAMLNNASSLLQTISFP